MSQKAFISEADTALANLIWNGIKDETAAKNIISSQEQISFSPPKEVTAAKTRKLSVFLYRITEEAAVKNVSPKSDSKEKSGQPIFAMHYLVTPTTGKDEDNHVLLEEVIHVLLATPSIADFNTENEVGLAVKVDSLSLVELTKLWTALGIPLRLSVSVTVSSALSGIGFQAQMETGARAALATAQTALPEAKTATQLYQAVLKTFTEQSEGWKNRNFVFKQWILQDFKKNTNMSVEEMCADLNSLGDKLERHEPTEQFVKPLNALTGYYKHQLEQMTGMQKVSRNQNENIETLNTWIKEVEDLLEILGT